MKPALTLFCIVTVAYAWTLSWIAGLLATGVMVAGYALGVWETRRAAG